jgi:hypothetical protein
MAEEIAETRWRSLIYMWMSEICCETVGNNLYLCIDYPIKIYDYLNQLFM